MDIPQPIQEALWGLIVIAIVGLGALLASVLAALKRAVDEWHKQNVTSKLVAEAEQTMPGKSGTEKLAHVKEAAGNAFDLASAEAAVYVLKGAKTNGTA